MSSLCFLTSSLCDSLSEVRVSASVPALSFVILGFEPLEVDEVESDEDFEGVEEEEEVEESDVDFEEDDDDDDDDF